MSAEDHAKVDTRYRDFRNFMCNELGITRQDIKAWTMESVSNEVQKLLGQMDIEKLAQNAITRAANEAVGTSNWSSHNGDKLRAEVAKELSKRIQFSTKD